MDASLDYRTKFQQSSDSDSNDSDDECAVWKRASRKPISKNMQEIAFLPIQTEPIAKSEHTNLGQDSPDIVENNCKSLKRKRNTIWSDVIQSQMISETLVHCGIKNKPKGFGSRGEESYDYTLAYSDPRNIKNFENRMSVDDISLSSEDSQQSLKNNKRQIKKFRRSHCSDGNSESSFDYKKKYKKPKEFVKLEQDELEAAKKIVRILNEKKQYIIYRVVKLAGIDKALSLLKKTEEIEESGGMMIKNLARRRTPGGVFMQLLRNDDDITQEMIDKIFEGEMSGKQMKEHYAELKKRRAEKKKLENEKKKLLENLQDLDSDQNESKESAPIEIDVEPQDNSTPDTSKALKSSDLEDGEISE